MDRKTWNKLSLSERITSLHRIGFMYANIAARRRWDEMPMWLRKELARNC